MNSINYYNMTYLAKDHGFYFFQINHGLISENGTML